MNDITNYNTNVMYSSGGLGNVMIVVIVCFVCILDNIVILLTVASKH